MRLIKHQIVVGSEVHEVVVQGKTIDGKVHLDIDSLVGAQRALARALIETSVGYDRALANFVINVIGEKASTLAKYLEVEPATISQIRHGKKCSAALWKLFRITAHSLLSEKRDRVLDRMIRGSTTA